jgi:hypothetical protein
MNVRDLINHLETFGDLNDEVILFLNGVEITGAVLEGVDRDLPKEQSIALFFSKEDQTS